MKKLFNLMLIASLAINSSSMAIFGGRAAQLAKYAKPTIRAFCTETTHTSAIQPTNALAIIPNRPLELILVPTVSTKSQTYQTSSAAKPTAQVAATTQANTSKKLILAMAGATGAALVGGTTYYYQSTQKEPVSLPDANQATPTQRVTPEPLLPKLNLNSIPEDTPALPKKFIGKGELKVLPKTVQEFVVELRELLTSHETKYVTSYLLQFTRAYALQDLEEIVPAIQIACLEASNQSNQRIMNDPSIKQQIQDSREDEIACTNCSELLSFLGKQHTSIQNKAIPVITAQAKLDLTKIETTELASKLDSANQKAQLSFYDLLKDQIQDLDLIISALKDDAAQRACTAKGSLFKDPRGWFNRWTSKDNNPVQYNLDHNNYTKLRNQAYLIDPLSNNFSKLEALEEILLTYKSILNQVLNGEKISAHKVKSILNQLKNNPYQDFIVVRLHELSSFIQE